ncbi:integrase catalytic domain-containing protein [Trichonephila clavipes]|nr:integrase catalytic domain-containing protein [Trichonephila clavipes]
MRQAIWAIFLHKLSTNEYPQHGFCPIGEDSWCGFKKAEASGKSYKHKNSLPIAVVEAMRPIFRDLSHPDLLKKCLHGKTQNPNESFHHVVWSRVPKATFVQIETLSLCVYDAVCSFNDELQSSDVGEESRSVQVLLGSDVIGKLMTGQRRILSCRLVAMETILAWTLSGKVPDSEISSCNAMLVDEEERFLVSLPWLDNHLPLLDNFNLAFKGLQVTTHKLKKENLFKEYDDVFKKWKREGIIEEVLKEEFKSVSHYLPHRHVVKPDSTTKIRPVFNASSKQKGVVILNNSLEKGLNLIELIPSILARFRLHRFGVSADIREALLQISLNQQDRNFLRFLLHSEEGELIHYRLRVAEWYLVSPAAHSYLAQQSSTTWRKG